MTLLLRIRTAITFAAGCILLAGCAPTVRSAESAEAQLQRMVGDSACSNDSHCRTLAWGHKACGGPERWVPWSTQSADEGALQRLARSHADARKAAQERDGIMSNCQFVTDPGARCVAQRCVLREGSSGAGDPATR